MGSKEWTSKKFAEIINTRVAPFLRRAFPEKASFRILLDGETVFHAPEAKAALKKQKI